MSDQPLRRWYRPARQARRGIWRPLVSFASALSAVAWCSRGQGALDAFVGATPPAVPRPTSTAAEAPRIRASLRGSKVACGIFGQGACGRADIPNVFGELESVNVESAMLTAQRWLDFLKGASGDRLLADASGYPLEHALELFMKELARGASTVVTMKLPDGVSDSLGTVGLVAAVRAGEDLDLSLFGEGEWETIHLDFMATNPLIEFASEVISGDLYKQLPSGRQLLQRLLDSAARAGRAVTVAPLNEQLKEHYRRLGFVEDSLLDPTLMFWVPNDEARLRLAYAVA